MRYNRFFMLLLSTRPSRLRFYTPSGIMANTRVFRRILRLKLCQEKLSR